MDELQFDAPAQERRDSNREIYKFRGTNWGGANCLPKTIIFLFFSSATFGCLDICHGNPKAQAECRRGCSRADNQASLAPGRAGDISLSEKSKMHANAFVFFHFTRFPIFPGREFVQKNLPNTNSSKTDQIEDNPTPIAW